MINIINQVIRCNDKRMVTALEIKLKACPEEMVNENEQHLVARVSAAFHASDLFAKYGKTLKTELNPRRKNVVNLVVSLHENSLSFKEIGEFVESFQEEIDKTPF